MSRVNLTIQGELAYNPCASAIDLALTGEINEGPLHRRD